MSKHQGAPPAGRPAVDKRRLLLNAFGLTLTLVAWGLLVWLAIDFGTEARSGSMLAWLFLLIATLGATGCLFLALSIGARLSGILKGDLTAVAPRQAGGKRAAR